MIDQKHAGKAKIVIIFVALFLVVATLLLLIFNAGKKSYVVQFDLNGGTLISGSLEQEIPHGQDAIPPKAVKDGAYLHSWSASYQRVTKNMVIRAIWEYDTTAGISYKDSSTYSEISGAYKYLQGEVYLGAYNGSKKVLGICDKAFADCTGITKIYLLDGLLSIGNEAFAGCSALTEIEIPKTVVRLGEGVLRDCEALEKLTLNEGLQTIGDGAFENCTSLTAIEIPKTVKRIGEGAFRGCESLEVLVLGEGIEEIAPNAFEGCSSLKTVIIPESVVEIGEDAFAGCEGLTIQASVPEAKIPERWAEGWNGSAKVEWAEEIVDPDADEDERDSDDSNTDPEVTVTDPTPDSPVA